MTQIRLKNAKRRTFSAELEQSLVGTRQTFRTTSDPKTGEEGTVFHSYNVYESFTLLPNQTSAPLDESILKNASISGAVRSKWLQVLR